VNINATIDETLIIIHNKIGTGIEVIKNYSELPSINLYVNEVNQVWTNIVSNACDAIYSQGEDATGKIILETKKEDDNIVVRISNDGPMIPPDNINKIFEQFYTTKKVGEGIGLGLSITYEIVKKHNGEINVESNEEFTTFKIELPAKGVDLNNVN